MKNRWLFSSLKTFYILENGWLLGPSQPSPLQHIEAQILQCFSYRLYFSKAEWFVLFLLSFCWLGPHLSWSVVPMCGCSAPTEWGLSSTGYRVGGVPQVSLGLVFHFCISVWWLLFLKACWHWLVLGGGVLLAITLLPLCWCPLVAFLSCVWAADSACLEPCSCSWWDQVIHFWAHLKNQRWLEKIQLSLHSLVLIPPGSITHFFVFQVLN